MFNQYKRKLLLTPKLGSHLKKNNILIKMIDRLMLTDLTAVYCENLTKGLQSESARLRYQQHNPNTRDAHSTERFTHVGDTGEPHQIAEHSGSYAET